MTASRRWTSCLPKTSPVRICLRPLVMPLTRSLTSEVAPRRAWVELASALQRAMGSDLKLEFGPPRGVNSVTRRQADISSARKQLSWKPEIDLDEGLRRLVAWWQSERALASEAGAR